MGFSASHNLTGLGLQACSALLSSSAMEMGETSLLQNCITILANCLEWGRHEQPQHSKGAESTPSVPQPWKLITEEGTLRCVSLPINTHATYLQHTKQWRLVGTETIITTELLAGREVGHGKLHVQGYNAGLSNERSTVSEEHIASVFKVEQ
jgi:hypothetical protein